MDHSPKTKPWTVARVVHELIAVWFGSVHITSTVRAITLRPNLHLADKRIQTACVALFDLCERPEYIDILRQEIEHTGWEEFDKSGGKLFPLMDSFMKESARLCPIESGTVFQHFPFQFSLL